MSTINESTVTSIIDKDNYTVVWSEDPDPKIVRGEDNGQFDDRVFTIDFSVSARGNLEKEARSKRPHPPESSVYLKTFYLSRPTKVLRNQFGLVHTPEFATKGGVEQGALWLKKRKEDGEDIDMFLEQ